MVSKDDPSRGVFEEVAKWNNTIECLPTWDELLEVEYVRQRGELNMFSGELQRYCFDRGLYNAVEWYERCKSARIHPFQLYSQAIEHYEKDRGPRDKWITENVRISYQERELDLKEAELTKQMRDLRQRKKAVKNSTGRR